MNIFNHEVGLLIPDGPDLEGCWEDENGFMRLWSKEEKFHNCIIDCNGESIAFINPIAVNLETGIVRPRNENDEELLIHYKSGCKDCNENLKELIRLNLNGVRADDFGL